MYIATKGLKWQYSSTTAAYCHYSNRSVLNFDLIHVPLKFQSHTWLTFDPRSDPNQRRLTLLQALSPWSPFIIMTILFWAWRDFSLTDIIEVELRIFYFTLGTVFSNVCVREIWLVDYVMWLSLSLSAPVSTDHISDVRPAMSAVESSLSSSPSLFLPLLPGCLLSRNGA